MLLLKGKGLQGHLIQVVTTTISTFAGTLTLFLLACLSLVTHQIHCPPRYGVSFHFISYFHFTTSSKVTDCNGSLLCDQEAVLLTVKILNIADKCQWED